MEELRNENCGVEDIVKDACECVTNCETGNKSYSNLIKIALITAGVVSGGVMYLHTKHKNKKLDEGQNNKTKKALRLVDIDEHGNIIVPYKEVEEGSTEEKTEE